MECSVLMNGLSEILETVVRISGVDRRVTGERTMRFLSDDRRKSFSPLDMENVDAEKPKKTASKLDSEVKEKKKKEKKSKETKSRRLSGLMTTRCKGMEPLRRLRE